MMTACLHSQAAQVKICGLTNTRDAVKIACLGADAIGLVFFKKSPRFVTRKKAKIICQALPETISKVGVFVDAPFDSIMETVFTCCLNTVQLHGNESPELVRDLMKLGLKVIKALYIESRPSLKTADTYDTSAYLVECAKGILPGGNAMAWPWEDAAGFGQNHPLILAGGLSPENVVSAINKAMPDVVDVSSGVENAPGRKDMDKVKNFIKQVRACPGKRQLRRIF